MALAKTLVIGQHNPGLPQSLQTRPPSRSVREPVNLFERDPSSGELSGNDATALGPEINR